MKRVLVLAYYFPPLGGAGVQRTVKFVKHLRDFGYEPIVITGPETTSVSWAPPDPALAADVPRDVEILRIGRPQPSVSGAERRLRRWLARPSVLERWWTEEATQLGATVAGDAHLLYASMSPFATAAVAARLARGAGKPWVADLRDPWALDEWAIYPSALHRRRDGRRMRHDLSSAAAVIMNTEEARSTLLRHFPEFHPTRVVTIPNGWDRDDFLVARHAPRDDERFRIVYTGYVHVEGGRRHQARRLLRTVLGGAQRGIDILARSHVFLVHGISRLREVDPTLASRVELHIAGAAPADQAVAADGVQIVHHGYLPHSEAVSLMCSADVLFLPMHDLPRGVRATTVPGKTYEYLASGRPILAALPEGDARDLLAKLPSARLCLPTDVACLTASLREIADMVPTPQLPGVELERFERRALTGQLATVFDEATRSSGPAEVAGTSRVRPGAASSA